MAFRVGQAFHAVARPVLLGLAGGLQEGPEFAAGSTADVSVAVTNLGFALELYLKSIRAWIGLDVPDTHDLWVLYKSIPIDIKNRVEHIYNSAVEARDPKTMFTLYAMIEASPDGPSKQPTFPELPSLRKDASNVLRRAKSLAVSWRYPHDSVKQGQRYSEVNCFEHSHLSILADSLVAFIQQNTQHAYASGTAA